MKSPLPFRLKKLRLEAADVPRIDLSGPIRRERDLLGERDIPVDALYGIQTLRAMENFCISGIELREFPTLVAALATVKEAAARANFDLKLLNRDIVDAISQAASEIREGLHHEHFRVDMIQGGAGTSSNMNANEVMANRALEILGKQRGQ
ncbi:MAG TPA: lyase family protein [Gemmatimonadaceae bacterium]